MPDSSRGAPLKRPNSIQDPRKFAPTPTITSTKPVVVKNQKQEEAKDQEAESEYEEEEEEEESETDPTVEVVNKSKGSYDPVNDRMIVIETETSDLLEESLARFHPDD